MSEPGCPGTDEEVAAELRRNNTARLVFGGTFLLPSVVALTILATAEFSFAAWVVATDVSLRAFSLVMSQCLIRRDDAKRRAEGPGIVRRELRNIGEKSARALGNPSWFRDFRLPSFYLVMSGLSRMSPSGRAMLPLEIFIALVLAGLIEVYVGRMLTRGMSTRALVLAGPVADAELREVASRVLATDGRGEAVAYVTDAGRCHIDEAMTVVDSLSPSKGYSS